MHAGKIGPLEQGWFSFAPASKSAATGKHLFMNKIQQQ